MMILSLPGTFVCSVGTVRSHLTYLNGNVDCMATVNAMNEKTRVVVGGCAKMCPIGVSRQRQNFRNRWNVAACCFFLCCCVDAMMLWITPVGSAEDNTGTGITATENTPTLRICSDQTSPRSRMPSARQSRKRASPCICCTWQVSTPKKNLQNGRARCWNRLIRKPNTVLRRSLRTMAISWLPFRRIPTNG